MILEKKEDSLISHLYEIYESRHEVFLLAYDATGMTQQEFDLTLTFDKNTWTIAFLVLPQKMEQLILGIDFFQHVGA